MKVIILAGGLPSTLIEEDEKVPKPMAEVGGRPILWHIMKQYAYYGHKDFIICTGYKGQMIKGYFMNFYIYQSDITVDLASNHIQIHKKQTEDWKVSIIDTGEGSTVSERIIKVREYLEEESVLITYGDCVSDIDITKMIEQHQTSRKSVTFAVARPAGRNKILPLDGDGNIGVYCAGENKVDAWVNACSMIFEPRALDFLDKNEPLLGSEMLEKLADQQQIGVYKHDGFWQPMETIRDKTELETMWKEKKAPWKVWKD